MSISDVMKEFSETYNLGKDRKKELISIFNKSLIEISLIPPIYPSWSRNPFSFLYCFTFAIAVWSVIICATSFILILTVVLGICAVLHQLITNGKLPVFMKESELIEFEEAHIIPMLPPRSISDSVSLPKAKMHRFLIEGHNPKCPILVLCHGTFSNAFASWFPALPELQKYCSSMHVLNLPGFGRSTAYADLKGMSGEETLDFIADVLHDYVAYINCKPILVGVSIGACIIAHTAWKYPSNFSGMILSSTAGILPTLGEKGFYYGLLFKICIPYILRLDRIGLTITYMLLAIMNEDKSTYYDFNLRFRSSSINDLPEKFIQLNLTSGVWRHHPLLPGILRTDVPVAFIHGKEDTIIPSHIVKLVKSLFDAPISCMEVKDSWHYPQFSNPKEFGESIASAIKCMGRPGVEAKHISYIIDNMNWSCWQSTHSISHTKKTVNELYNHLISISKRIKLISECNKTKKKQNKQNKQNKH